MRCTASIFALLLSACWLTSGLAFNQAQQLFLLCVRNTPPPPLPYDAEVEYLESTGTQYIDTGYYPNGTTFGYKFDVMLFNDLSGTRTIAGCWGPQYNRSGWCFSIGGNYKNNYGGSNFNWRGAWEGRARINVGERSTVVVKNIGYSQESGGYLINVESPLENGMVVYDNVYSGTAGNTFVLFGVRNGEAQSISEIAHCRIYEAVLYENDTVVMHFVPVRFTNDRGESEAAMYDRVSGALFRNAGTGAFVIGPDK